MHQNIWIILMAGAAAFALLRGGAPERLTALAIVVAWTASTVVAQWSRHWLDPQWGVLAVDIALLGMLLWIALRSDRFWPLFATAFQLLGVITHLAIMADRTLVGPGYFVAAVIWSYLVVIALAAGTWNVWRARAAGPIPA